MVHNVTSVTGKNVEQRMESAEFGAYDDISFSGVLRKVPEGRENTSEKYLAVKAIRQQLR